MKQSILIIFVIALFSISVLAGCKSRESTTQPSGSSESSETQSTNIKTQTSSTTSDNADAILSLKTEDYQSMSVKDFNSQIQSAIDNDSDFLSTYSDLLDSIEESDSNYSFVIETLNYSVEEIIRSLMGDTVSISDYIKKCTLENPKIQSIEIIYGDQVYLK